MTENTVTKGWRYLLAIALMITVFAGLLPTVAAKTISSGVSVNVRVNSKGKKVNLGSSPAYKEAVATFMNKKYADALGKFQTLDKNGFCCDMVHYYIAQCYQYTNQVNPAMSNYEWVSVYSKDPRLIYYANGAYEQLAYYNGHRTYSGQGNNFDRNTFRSRMRASGC